MSQDQTNPGEDKKVPTTKLDQVNADLAKNKLKEDEQGKIEGGFAAGRIIESDKEAEDNLWCNTNC